MTARGRVDLRDDRGATLMELVIAMTLLSIFMGIFTVSMTMMTSTTSRIQAVADSSHQANNVFLTLDRSLRYATGISVPSQNTAATWHVEFAAADLSDGTAREMCTQLRVANSQLQQRTWVVSGTTYRAGSLTAWKPLASGVTNGAVAPASGDQPFSLPVAGASAASAYQRLTITVLTSSGQGGSSSTNRSSSTVAALNSTAGSTASVCQQVPVEQAS